jgi:hypothetical protein
MSEEKGFRPGEPEEVRLEEDEDDDVEGHVRLRSEDEDSDEPDVEGHVRPGA